MPRPKSTTTDPKQYVREYHPGHPLAGKAAHLSEHRKVLYGKIGPGQHSCHWCGAIVEWTVGIRGCRKGMLITDHIDSNRHNNSPSNLVPCCTRCNVVRPIDTRLADHGVVKVGGNGKRLCGEIRTCPCGKEFIAAYYEIRIGKGKYCSRECVYQFRSQWTGPVKYRSGQWCSAEERTCKVCGRSFLFILADANFKKGECCSRSCATKNRWRTNPLH